MEEALRRHGERSRKGSAGGVIAQRAEKDTYPTWVFKQVVNFLFLKSYLFILFFFLVRLNALLVFGHVQLVKDKN